MLGEPSMVTRGVIVMRLRPDGGCGCLIILIVKVVGVKDGATALVTASTPNPVFIVVCHGTSARSSSNGSALVRFIDHSFGGGTGLAISGNDPS